MQLAAPPCSPSLPPPPTGILGCSRPIVHIPERMRPALSSLSALYQEKVDGLAHSRVGLIECKLSLILYENSRFTLDLLLAKARHSQSCFPARRPSGSQLLAAILRTLPEFPVQFSAQLLEQRFQNSKGIPGL